MGPSADTSALPYSRWTELNCIVCIVAAGFAFVAGVILFVHYFFCPFSNILRSAFNDVFVAVVVVQALQALQLFVFSLMTVVEGRRTAHDISEWGGGGTSSRGMTYAMCNTNASLHQFLDASTQLLQTAFFLVVANSRRLTSLEELDVSDDERVVRTGASGFHESVLLDDERAYSSSGRSSASTAARPCGAGDTQPKRHNRDSQVQQDPSLCCSCLYSLKRLCRGVFPCCCCWATKWRVATTSLSALHGPLVPPIVEEDVAVESGRHTLLRVTWKVYLAALLYASCSLLLCWLVLAYVPGLVVAPRGGADHGDSSSSGSYSSGSINNDVEPRRTVHNTLFFTQEFAWCWIPSGDTLSPPVSPQEKTILVLLQVVAAYASPVVFFFSATYAYLALRRCSPSLLRDHPIVLWRISVFCVYPTVVYILGALERFVVMPVSFSTSATTNTANYHDGGSDVCMWLSVVVSFMYPFTAVVNVVLFVYTEELLRGILATCCSRCGNSNAEGNTDHDSFDCSSNVAQDRVISDGGDSNSVIATTGFCGVVKAIACSTVTGLPPGAATYIFASRPVALGPSSHHNRSAASGPLSSYLQLSTSARTGASNITSNARVDQLPTSSR
ncbi:hypothetical protein DQ04_10551010 [Trypanosoma grayi]|uniref:hypothetical protein n=1 Tax=Trypanosoma grayi TaxID=71804 RepID=UPI0004F4B95A|nr:hypothetical protein DQ04_10551010 [Trypanosoma grayi]KEG07210.1 hypothetical protein DQ04_10551010 [Trypanosoma grayi]